MDGSDASPATTALGYASAIVSRAGAEQLRERLRALAGELAGEGRTLLPAGSTGWHTIRLIRD